MADSDATDPDLISLRKSRAQYQSAATRIKNRLQTMLKDEDPATLDLNNLAEKYESIDTTERRGNRTHDSIAVEETDESKQEADQDARDLFQESISKAKILCKCSSQHVAMPMRWTSTWAA